MNGAELVGLLVSAGLLLYLVIALLKPEWFACGQCRYFFQGSSAKVQFKTSATSVRTFQ